MKHLRQDTIVLGSGSKILALTKIFAGLEFALAFEFRTFLSCLSDKQHGLLKFRSSDL